MELVLLTLRLAVGLAFAAHGAQKLFGAFGGAGIEGTARWFEEIGLQPGRLQARAAGTTELLGGAFIAVGFMTPFAAAALIAVMTAAVLTVSLPNGFDITRDGYEYNAVLVATMFVLAGIGSGPWSLDGVVGTEVTGTLWALGALGAGVLGGLGAVFNGRLVSARNSGAGQHLSQRNLKEVAER